MARRQEEQDAVNADSFVDIVASVVSIMLIMVMIIGMRIRDVSVDEIAAAAVEEADEQLHTQLAGEERLRGEIMAAAEQMQAVERETASRAGQRDALAVVVAALEHDVRTHRERLGADEGQHHELIQNVAMVRQQLQSLERQREAIEPVESPPVVLQSYPTPLSRTVDEYETHFQLRGGRIVYVPLEALIQEFKADVMRQVQRLRNAAEMTDVVGPIGGFRLRYTMVRTDVTLDGAVIAAGAKAELERWTLMPVADDLGETVDVALAEGSEFRRAVARCNPARGAITLWVYTDSFDAFRRIREELYHQGYMIAARPMPPGESISGSPSGSKSSAQ